MKKILSISIFLIICTLGHSQETNKELLKNAETELSAALEKEDYEKAASLKKEIVMRKEIEEAVKNGNYEKASNLKKEIESGAISTEVLKEDNINTSTSMASSGFVQPPSDKAAVYFVRKNIFGTAMRMNFFDNLQFIGAAIGGTYVRYECNPGDHLFWTWCESNDHKAYLSAVLEKGKTYIIEVYAARVSTKERKLSGKRPRNYFYTLNIEAIKPSDKRLNQLISFVKKESSRSYPEKVLRRLNSEFQIEIREAEKNFENKRNNIALMAIDNVPDNLLE